MSADESLHRLLAWHKNHVSEFGSDLYENFRAIAAELDRLRRVNELQTEAIRLIGETIALLKGEKA